MAVSGATGRLSGGWRQRLLLARALLADPQALVLDELAAHLDTETERRVLADLLRVARRRTLLLSTHRRVGASELDAVVTLNRPSPAREDNREQDRPLGRGPNIGGAPRCSPELPGAARCR